MAAGLRLHIPNQDYSGLDSPIPPALTSLAQALDESGELLELADDWDEQGSPGYQESTLEVANRLADLVGDVYNLTIDRDERRELLTVLVTNRDKTVMQARALSNGTLRFLALAILEPDPQTQGVLCLEEPENGIHPARIPAILSLLQDIATDTSEPVGPDNPLRRVIVNTHSPAVVGQAPDDSLLVAELRDTVVGGLHYKRAVFAALPDTWRVKASADKHEVPKGQLLAYLNPIAPNDIDTMSLNGNGRRHSERGRARPTRVVDRPDLQLLLPFSSHQG